MRSRTAIIAASILSFVWAEQAAADNAGAAFVGGLLGGAIGSAISNAPRKSSGTSRSSRPAKKAPAAKAAKSSGTAGAPAAASTPWMASPIPAGGVIVTNGQGLTFTYDDAGNPRLIIQPNVFIPPAAYETMLPVSVMVDGKAFGILQAEVQKMGLVVDDVQVMLLEQQLKPAHEVVLTSTFATLTLPLSGFTKAIEQLAIARQQQAILSASNPDKAKAVAEGNMQASTTTVVQVQVAGTEPAQQQAVIQAGAAASTSATVQPAAAQATGVSTTATIEVSEADQTNRRIGELRIEIDILMKVLSEQKQEQSSTGDAEEKATLEDTIAAIASRIDILEQEYDAKNQSFELYLTSVRPNDRDLYLTARKASQVFPKVPYYIPGTKEHGEFWVEPKVTQVGELMFNFRLIDPEAENDTTRDMIEVNVTELETIRGALVKLRKNSKIAHEKKIRKNYAKRMVCFPEPQCPAERQNGEKGKSSTEVVFQVYEDGSTAGRLQLNKGAFQEGVNFSVDSALLLQAYLAHVIKEAKLEYSSGTQTQKDLDEMFQ